MASKTKKPTGMKLTRKGNDVILSWKIADKDYKDGQKLYSDIFTGKTKYDKKKKKNVLSTSKKRTNKKLGVKATSYTLKLNPKNYYPYKNEKGVVLPFLVKLGFGVAGKKDGSAWSAWTKLTKAISAPRKPKISAELSNDYDNVTKFSWSKIDDNTSFNWFTDYERETVLVKNCNATKGEDVSWKNATTYNTPGTTTASHNVTESVVFEGNYSYARWYRVRCRGPRGASPWAYASHVYAFPAPAENVVGSVDVGNINRGYYRINLKWKADESTAHPIDKTVVEYLVTTPATKQEIKTDEYGIQYSHTELIAPDFTGGTEVSVTKDTKGEDGMPFSIPHVSSIDNCVVVRVNTYHDRQKAQGKTTYIDGSFGNLAKPTIVDIGSVIPGTRRINISATNNSEVPNTHLVVTYKTETEPDVIHNIGIIPAGKGNVTLILPESALTTPYVIGVKARCGDYSPIRPSATDTTYYELSNLLISSDIVWGEGTVPQPPQQIELTSPSSGTIRVSWNWSWLDATGAELSWSTHKDAWESTDEPSTYIVNNTAAGAWNISGLEVGTWYVRIRLFKTDGETNIYGAYSEIKEIKLSSAPDTPSLTLQPDNGVITEDGQITCLWAYVTNDGTAQEQAAICEAFLNEDGTFTYGEVIARTSTTQYITLVASKQDPPWKEGETHYLAVKVVSASGEESEDWSTPKAVTIARKLNIVVTDTTLVDVTETIEDGDEVVTNTYKQLTNMPLGVTFGLAVPYSLSTDVAVEPGKTYYVKDGDNYITPPPAFSPNPTGNYEKIVTELSYNPSQLGYYEIDPEDDLAYILTEDTEWDIDKTYFIRSGEGTEEDPYIYTAVPIPPFEEISYSLTSDSVWDDTKVYYFRAGIIDELSMFNPIELNYYEVDMENPGLYIPTSDSIWDYTKDYYSKDDNDVYTLVDCYIYNEAIKPIEDPSSLEYYEPQDIEGEVTLIIERAEPYPMDRPDETDYDGFEGETIAMITHTNSGTVYFEQDDERVGILDDNAKYRLIVSAVDTYGQTAETEPLEFIVKWDHQAVMPEAEVETFDDDIYATIQTIAPSDYELTPDIEVVEGKTYYSRTGEGTDEDPYVYEEISNPTGNPKESQYFQVYDYSRDTCDIYRLSVDYPILVVKDAAFGTKYVDPYPTLKEFGGYRIVYKTVNGDYITEDNRLAWEDYVDSDLHQIDRFLTIIDFNKDQVILPYDLELSNKWSKDFIETKYLGGSVQGDWNPAVSRTGTVKTNTIVFEDPDTIKAMRRLATYAGICHVRTPDGSNFTANVDVNEDRENKKIGKIAKFSLDITRVDPEDQDGMPYTSWVSENE